MDGDLSGSIGWEELKEPLIGLGLADDIDEVKQLIEHVDEDGSGMIEFPEFLSIMRNTDNSNAKTQAITTFFQNLTAQKYGTIEGSAFNQFVQSQKRAYIWQAMKRQTSPKAKEKA